MHLTCCFFAPTTDGVEQDSQRRAVSSELFQRTVRKSPTKFPWQPRRLLPRKRQYPGGSLHCQCFQQVKTILGALVWFFGFICCQYWPTAPQEPFLSSKGPQLHLLERGLNLSFGRIQSSSSMIPSSAAPSQHLR